MTSNVTQEQLRVLRHMAWERAKGELRSMERTYLSTQGHTHIDFCDACDAFIKEIDEILQDSLPVDPRDEETD